MRTRYRIVWDTAASQSQVTRTVNTHAIKNFDTKPPAIDHGATVTRNNQPSQLAIKNRTRPDRRRTHRRRRSLPAARIGPYHANRPATPVHRRRTERPGCHTTPVCSASPAAGRGRSERSLCRQPR
ncbi:DUF2188 domain-containing protein [Salinisphaera sp. Q1T1-3]|uniref:DUF2188 domain-containing protein n=1 Tax=Salinisphaera sp. Q1T1-3 TaxID=2321229 RepID=UPI00351A0A0D